MQLNPYLNFNGDCEAAFRFYEQVLGGRLDGMTTHGASPIADEVPASWHDRIMHARLIVGNTVLMGSDIPPEHYERPRGVFVAIQIDDPKDADRIFDALSKDGSVIMPVAKTFWAERFGMLVDRFGISWMVNCTGAA